MQATPAAAAAAQSDSKCDDFAAPAEARGGSDQKAWVAIVFWSVQEAPQPREIRGRFFHEMDFLFA